MESLMQYAEGDESPTTIESANEIPATEPSNADDSVAVDERIKTEENPQGRDEEEEEDDEYLNFRLQLPEKTAAPAVNDEIVVSSLSGAIVRSGTGPERAPLDVTQRLVHYNPTFDQLWAPVVGPSHPFFKDGLSRGAKNHKLGIVEDAALEPFLFDEQYYTFQAYGYGVDPASVAGDLMVGDQEKIDEMDGNTVYSLKQQDQRLLKKRKKEGAISEKPEAEAGEEKEGTDGIDGFGEKKGDDIFNVASEDWLLKNSKSPWAGKKEAALPELTEEQKKYAQVHAEKKAKSGKEPVIELEAKSTFHGKDETDYQGRSWLAPPKDKKPNVDHCYIPKRWIHTWSGHTKGVSAIRFFPKYGHLLLSASMDTKIKIWDVYDSGKCMRTYMGHGKAVRDITFSNDGKKFVSAGYDKKINLWDTETGQVVRTFTTGKLPYVVKLHPDDDKQNILLAGMSDKKIVQWDTNTGEVTQEYDQHLGAVNTITFLDDNRRFVTSSDDKSLRVWEFGIPVVIKYISEPHMHSMPSVAVHPNKAWVACQSLDNQILVYGAKDKFRLNKNKRFAGHVIAGYACQVNFSPDGRFILSGDGEGKCWFWDWKTCKVFRTLKCHDSVCIGVEWNPMEQSRLATCGWDGLIKYWD